MREQKRQRDLDRKAKEDKLAGASGGRLFGDDGRPNIDNAFIERILRDEDPYAAPEKEEGKTEAQGGREELKVSQFVVDLEIHPPVSNKLIHIYFDGARRKKQ